MHILSKRVVVAGALLVAAYAIAGVSSAQTTTTTTTTTAPTVKAKVHTTATPEMIADAVARSKARRDKFLTTGAPEQFGSEEPYTATTK
jgi:hypothetical protein